MTDQASILRAMHAAGGDPARQSVAPRPPSPPVMVIGSGKGGAGKSVIAVLLAARLASRGGRVLLVDGSQNLGNLHVMLGVHPGARLEHLLADAAAPADLLIGVTDQLWLLPGDSGAESVYALGSMDRARLHHRLSGLFDGFDAVIVDADSGLESVVRAATMRATRLVMVTNPEPAALTDAYATIKIVNLQVKDLPIHVLVNRAADEADGLVAYDRLATATERFLQRDVQYLGTMPEHALIRLAVREPGRLVNCLQEEAIAGTIESMLDLLDLPAPAREPA